MKNGGLVTSDSCVVIPDAFRAIQIVKQAIQRSLELDKGSILVEFCSVLSSNIEL
jgi:hypothetical protein